MSGPSFNVVSTGVYHVGTIFDISKTHNLFLLLTPQNQRVSNKTSKTAHCHRPILLYPTNLEATELHAYEKSQE